MKIMRTLVLTILLDRLPKFLDHRPGDAIGTTHLPR